MWKKVTLGDVCKIVNGGTPKSNVKMYWEGDVQWLTPKDMGKIEGKYVDLTERQITKDGLNNSSAKLVPANSVILSCRAPIGHVFINTIDMSFNQGCKGLVPTADIITEYLYYFLFSSKQLLNDLGTGTTFKEISGKTLANVELLLPPIAEQQRIVAKLDATFAEIDKAIELNDKRTKEVKNLIAQSQNQLFLSIPETVSVMRLGDVAKFENGDRGKNYPSKKYQIDEGIPFVNAGDFSLDGDIETQSMVYISEERFNLLGAGKFKIDDVLFCLRGSLGKSAINKSIEIGAIASSLVILRAKQNIVSSDYLFAYIRSDIVKNLIVQTAGGAAQPNLSAKVVSNYEIAVPPLREQQRLTEKFWLIREHGLVALDRISQKSQQLIELKAAILSKELQRKESEAA